MNDVSPTTDADAGAGRACSRICRA
jgi:hypothetical protein